MHNAEDGIQNEDAAPLGFTVNNRASSAGRQ